MAGPWVKWLANTTATSATFSSPVVSHIYYFRSVALDAVGDTETLVPPEGDSHTTAVALQATGQVFNNRHQPIFNATVLTQPAMLNVACSDNGGRYVLYLAKTGVFDVIAAAPVTGHSRRCTTWPPTATWPAWTSCCRRRKTSWSTAAGRPAT